MHRHAADIGTASAPVRTNLLEKSMTNKELNKPMNREQLNTPAASPVELTEEQLDQVTGGGAVNKFIDIDSRLQPKTTGSGTFAPGPGTKFNENNHLSL
jgi:hypothetical protein